MIGNTLGFPVGIPRMCFSRRLRAFGPAVMLGQGCENRSSRVHQGKRIEVFDHAADSRQHVDKVDVRGGPDSAARFAALEKASNIENAQSLALQGVQALRRDSPGGRDSERFATCGSRDWTPPRSGLCCALMTCAGQLAYRPISGDHRS